MIKQMLFFLFLFCSACGPVPPPSNAYRSGPDLMRDLVARRTGIHSFRITGIVDHFGEDQRIQGKIYLFAVFPNELRIELVSPFGNPLTILTANKERFSLHDIREGRFLTGPAQPCNIARLIRIPLPAEDVLSILVGHTPLLDGVPEVVWHREGFYRVTIRVGERTQILDIGPNRETLPLLRSKLEDKSGTVFEIQYDRWRPVQGTPIPHEIRVKMPRDKADLLLRYDEEGVELNVDLPTDAWTLTAPAGLQVEQVQCSSRQ